MGHIGSAFGIVIGVEDSHGGGRDVLKVVAKRVIERANTGVVREFTPREYCETHNDEDSDYVEGTVDVELHEDVGGKTLTFTSNGDIWGEIEYTSYSYVNDPTIRVGNPTSCSSMIYVAACTAYSDSVAPISFEIIMKLIAWRAALVVSGRLNPTCSLALVENCCS